MSRIYLPNSKQFKRINEHLKTIAGTMAMQIDTSTWENVQKIVEMGAASRFFPVGTQFVVNHSIYGDMVFDVVAHDHFKSATDENAHTMTLMSHDMISRMYFDEAEAFYYADAELPAGTYNFTIPTTYGSWIAGTYQFTLNYSLPKGGVLAINGNSTIDLTSCHVTTHITITDNFSTEMVSITSGNAGMNLGSFGVELNHVHRVSYGSNNYKESAIRQFLNSSDTMGNVWTPRTQYDRPPNWVTSLDGFMAGLGDEFLSVVGRVVVPCSANNTFESTDSTTIKGGKYTVFDKFYLASQTEIFGDSSPDEKDDSMLLPYYEGSTDADRVKYDSDGVARRCWTRSPLSTHATALHTVGSAGDRTYTATHDNCGVVPVCTIV